MRRSVVRVSLVAVLLALAPRPSRACVPGDACCMALPAGADVADIFHDKLGHLGTQLPAYGTLTNPARTTSCLGVTTDPHTLGGYSCSGPSITGSSDPHFYAEKLDHYWVQTYRTCPDGTMPADQVGGCYYPPNGLIYDLGGPSNKVVLFPMIDHGPLPQEAFEYSVYLSDNPAATDTVPRGMQTDPQKWNEATLLEFYEQGWNPDLADVSDDDVTVWGLPCGINFHYVSLVPGNAGNPSMACVYDSSEYEIDAVAGLTEDEQGICPDEDHDGHTAASCGGDDCNDMDPSVHPGAPEPCDATMDLNCDGKIGGCPTGETCTMHVCLAPCGGGEFPCSGSQSCVGGYCVDSPCGSGPPCPPGKVCQAGQCVDPCTNAACPHGEACIDGACVDLCKDIQCAMNQVCVGGACGPSCACTGCAAGSSCDTPSGRCVDAACVGVTCPAGERCVAGKCVDACSGVQCPVGDRCAAGACVPDPCFGRDCGAGRTCAPSTGMCFIDADGGLDLGAPVDLGDARGDSATVDGTTVIGGCGCRVAARAPAPAGALSAFALAAASLLVRRRRR